MPREDDHVDAGKHFTPGEHYPSAIHFASQPSENRAKVVAGGKARRPGGAMRGSGPWHTSACESTDEGGGHAKSDARSPNPTPNIGMAMLKGLEGRLMKRIKGGSESVPGSAGAQQQSPAAGKGQPVIPPLLD